MLKYQIDSPQKKLIQRLTGNIVVSGWFFDDETGLAPDHVFVSVGKREFKCDRTERQDVVRNFSNNSPRVEKRCGFEVDLSLKPGLKCIRVLTKNGNVLIEIAKFVVYVVEKGTLDHPKNKIPHDGQIETNQSVNKAQPEIHCTSSLQASHDKRKVTEKSEETPEENPDGAVCPATPIYVGKLESFDNNQLRGWVVKEGEPAAVFELKIKVDDVQFYTIKNDLNREDLLRHKKSAGQGGFSYQLPRELFGESARIIKIYSPDNRLFAEAKIPQQPTLELNAYARIPVQEKVSIIVPIYNAPDDLQLCIERLLKYTRPEVDIILIDDASPDERIQVILQETKKHANFRIFKNEQNLGYTKTVNRGIELAGNNDVVFLNSDARVTPKWLEGLRAALTTDLKIATVTPMSDRAGAFSAPNIGNDNKLPEGVDEITFARAFRRRGLGLYPKVPTGNGFCMYVRRACINAIGVLDAEAFPRGYGEENDFCMRALRAGWSNVIDDRTYVFHDRSKSFGETNTELLENGRAVIDARYPEYGKAIRIYSDSEKIAMARFQARLAGQDCVKEIGKNWVPRVLFVIATQAGGTPQTNRDLMEALSGTFDCWTLRCDSKMLELQRMNEDGTTTIVYSHDLREPVDPLTHNSSEYDAVVSHWLNKLDFDLVHIRHSGWHGLSLPRLARKSGQKVVFSFHDFYALSSNFKLIDDKGIFLGNTFLEKGSIYRECLWPKHALPTPNGNSLTFWRERFQNALEYCDACVTTAKSARELVLDKLPKLSAHPFAVIPHGRDFPRFHRVRKKPTKKEKVRILVPGHINAVKGLEIIRALIEHDKSGKLEFHILGRLIGKKPKRGIVELGAYERNEFAEKAATVRPHLGIVFSVWDETYCHTLTELWSVGLPVAVLDFPNVADRVRRSGAGWVLDHENIPRLYDEILRIAFDNDEYERTERAIADWQGGYGLANSTAQMAAGYLNIYSDLLSGGGEKKQLLSPHSRKRIGVVCPASADLRHATGSTHIRIWERTRNTVERNVIYIKMTPAMLVASAKEKMLDGAIIQRTAIPKELIEDVISMLAQSNIPYSLDLDDDLINVPGDKDPDGSYASYAPFFRKLIASAAAVTVSTPALQEKLREMNARVELMPNQLSDRLWCIEPPSRVADGTIRALYMGSASHDDDLEMILPALDAVAKSCPQFRLALVGVSARKDLTHGRPWLETLEIPAKNYPEFTNWLHSQADKFDFGIAPLREKTFNKNKSDLKLLDYGVLSLPVIASDISVYNASNAPCVTLIDNTTQEWSKALHQQIMLGGENKLLGLQLRKWVLQKRMLGKTLPNFDALIIDLVEDQKKKQILQEPIKHKRADRLARIAVCVHIFYPHRWKLISEFLRNIRQEFDLFVTFPKELIDKVADVRADYPRVVMMPVENSGMDVLPFLAVVAKYELHNYDAVLKLHTKNDKTNIGDTLGRLSLDGLLGTPELVDRVLNQFLDHNDIGMLGSECLYRSAMKTMYDNRPRIEKLLRMCSIDWPSVEWGFFAGTMFWLRGELLATLVSHFSEISRSVDAEKENAVTGGDGSWVHAMERAFGLLPMLSNMSVAVSYPATENSGHTHIRKTPDARQGSKRAFHGFSIDQLSRYENLSDWTVVCRNSSFFDETYYREKAGNLLPMEMDAATHFVLFGDIFGLDPSRQFCVNSYRKKHPDVANADPAIPSLVHFLTRGAEEDFASLDGLSTSTGKK